MQIEASRRSTFLGTPAGTFLAPAPARRTAKSKATVLPTNGPQWPHTATTHPHLTPDELARAGYYYAPEPTSKGAATGRGTARRTTSRAAKSTTSKASTSRAGRKTKVSSAISDTDPSDTASEFDDSLADEMDDQCCCFTCGKKLGGWDETDDPYEEHWKRSENIANGEGKSDSGDDIACAWATAVCSVVIHVKRWKDGSLAGTSGKGSTGKRGKMRQISADMMTPYVYPKASAHLHPQSQLMTRARQQTYHPSPHITSPTTRDNKAKASDAGWWPHKVKRAWLCTVSNLAKAGFVYTPTTEEKDCVTCFYCNYSVSDWEPTDDPWKQHHDKSPNCPFFTEGIEGQYVDESQGEDAVELADDTNELADLPTVRSRAVAGSTRPTSRATVAKARRTITATVPTSSALDRSTTRSRIPKSAAATATPRVARIPGHTPASDDVDVAAHDEVANPTTKARPKRGTTTTKPPASAISTASKSRTVKAKSEPKITPSNDDDDDFDELPLRAEKSKSQTRSKSSKTTSVASTSESSVADVVPPKKVAAVRKGKPAASAQNGKVGPSEHPAVGKSSKKVPSLPVASSVQHVPPSPPTTASEFYDTEQEDLDAEERAEYLKEEEAVKSNRLQMVEAGAKEALAVLQNLGSKRANTMPVQADEAATPPTISISASISNIEDPIALTAEEEEMTVVEYVRRMYALRQAALRTAGEGKIQDWQEKAKQARDFIQSIPARDQ